jgi:hypothetical protein
MALAPEVDTFPKIYALENAPSCTDLHDLDPTSVL